MSDTRGHPWLKPLYRRVIVTIVCALWVTFEVYQESTFWFAVAVIALGYALWDFFLSGNYRTSDEN